MKSVLTACLLMTATPAFATAQGLPPEAATPEVRPPETKAERQRNSAAKLAGLLDFVKSACPELTPDETRFKDVVAGLGVTREDLSAGDLFLRARTYAEVYSKDTPANCSRAESNFGPTGTTIPGLVGKRAAP